MTTSVHFVFFGTPEIAVASLEELFSRGMVPSLIVTAPDKPRGRGRTVSPTPVRVWGDAHGIPVATPLRMSDPEFLAELAEQSADVFVVVAYGKILPPTLLALPRMGTLNMHPSLLPKHRGPSPIESQILNEPSGEHVGVSIMLLDEEMDHGPTLAQKSGFPEITAEWPMSAHTLYPILAREGATLLAETISHYVKGGVTPLPQNHTDATYCKKITKEDALIDFTEPAELNYRKINAYALHPRPYFFVEKHGTTMRVIITHAELSADGSLVITRVIPEGRKEMGYAEFVRM